MVKGISDFELSYLVNGLTGMINNKVDNVDISDAATANKLLKLNNEAKLPADITGNAATASNVEWSGIKNRPTDVEGYGITELPANLLSGVIPIEKIPHGALGRCVVVSNDDERFALTIDDVKIGDTVKVNETGKMYFVIDDTKLDSEEGYETYSTSVDWSSITNIPNNISGFGIIDAVNKNDVTDIATANKLLKLDSDARLPADITGNAVTATNVEWSGVQNTPTTLDDYGITDAVNSSDVTTTATANKLLKLNSSKKLPADITGNAATASSVEWSGVQNTPNTLSGYGITALPANLLSGTISIENLPHGALERCVVVETDADRFKLTTDTVQTGDTIKVNTSGKMYFVVDDTKLTSSDGYAEYTVGTASSVAWSGVTGKPTTISGYGITDAVKLNQISSTASANKILVLNSEAKLPADITGNAVTATNVEWSGVQNTPTTIAGYGITDVYTKTESDNNFVNKDQIDVTPSPFKILRVNKYGSLSTDITGNAATATNVEWSGVQNTPNTLSGYGITALPANLLSGTIPIENLPHGALERCVIVFDSIDRLKLTKDRVQTGDTVKESLSGMMYFVKDDTKLNSEDGYEVYTVGSASTVAWSGVTDKPNTLSGYGITDAVNSNDVTTTATANKLLKLNSSKKLPADITGNAATATKLSSSRTISLTGVITGSAKFDGSANASITTTIDTLVITGDNYGSTLPTAGTIGRVFFKKV